MLDYVYIARGNIMKKLRAFTQVELVSVVAILGALAAITVPRLMANPDTAKKAACQTNIDIINRLSDIYLTQHNKPATLDDIVSNQDTFPDGPPKCPYGTPYVMGPNGHIIPHDHTGGQ
jgi:type II secretory pathway pseudopilin PulG